VIYVTSTPISDTIIDYYLHLLPGIPGIARTQPADAGILQ
jgi:hypothetical protein